MISSVYLDRYAWKQPLFPDFDVPKDSGIIVVLPAFKEENIATALESLNQCTAPSRSVMILIVVNEPKGADPETQRINLRCMDIIKNYPMQYVTLMSYIKLPIKKAGVGLARKVGMDEAVRMFRKIDHDGTIVCYDADCRCDKNYLIEIEKTYLLPDTNAGIVFYEHQLNHKNHDAILNYELYLRYYVNAIRFTGFPYAHQTLGSCITVRCSIYEKVGGMNTRKAGEDFYFLNKTIPHEGFKEINTTTVRPSDRTSDRVPFGTGKAVHDILNSNEIDNVYHPNSFEDLKLFFDKIDLFWDEEVWKIPKTIISFLGDEWNEEISSIKNQASSKNQFKKRFFHLVQRI